MLEPFIEIISKNRDLTESQMKRCTAHLISGKADPQETEKLLTALHQKGESTSELVGAASALREAMIFAQLDTPALVDTCGTGGDGSETFNISTAAGIVAAAAGVKVAKHGNRKITSKTGSADALTQLGVKISEDVASAKKCLDACGLCFLMAPVFHPAVRHVSAVRQKLPFPTLFNLLGPLANPAKTPHQVLGIGRKGAWEKIVPALEILQPELSIAVRGDDDLGELSICAESRVAIIENGKSELQKWHPTDFGLKTGKLDEIQVDGPESSARLIREILDGRPGSARDIVVLNAAAATWVSGNQANMVDGVKICQEVIDNGTAKRTLEALAEASGN